MAILPIMELTELDKFMWDNNRTDKVLACLEHMRAKATAYETLLEILQVLLSDIDEDRLKIIELTLKKWK